MTVTRDAVAEFAVFTTVSPATLLFTPTGTPRGISVHVVTNGEATDRVTSVTYGGVAMQRIITSTDIISETARVWTYFLGSGIPTGPQTVSIAHTGGGLEKWAVVQSVTAAADTECGTAAYIKQDIANPSVLLDSGSREALRVGIWFSGHNLLSAFTPLAGMEAVGAANSHQFADQSALLAQQTTASTGTFTLGFTAANEDSAACAIAIEEVTTGGFPKATAPTLTFFPALTSHPVPIPDRVDAGDLLFIFFSTLSTTVTTPADWTLLNTATNSVRLLTYYKIADGSEGGTLVDLVSTVAGAAAGQALRVTDWHGTTPPEVGTFSTGASVNPNPPTLTPSWGAADTLWIAAYALAASTAITSAFPASYDNGACAYQNGTQSSAVATARRDLNAAADDPGTFTSSLSGAWAAQTVAVRPVVAVAPDAPAGLTASRDSALGIDLVWGNVTGETGFRVERSLDGSTGWVDLGDVAADTLTFTDTGLACGTEYFYRVFAFNGTGDSPASNVDSWTTDTCSAVTVLADEVTVTGGFTVTIVTDPGGVQVYQGAAGTVTLPAGDYLWTSTDGGAGGSFSVVAAPTPSGGGSRMGGTGAVRKPPR